jgi:hypothetical protein
MWPGAKTPGADWLAVVQYRFVDGKPDPQCLSVPLLVHLTRSNADWRVVERFLLDTHEHIGIEEIQLVDLTGDGREELVIESDTGEEEASASEVHVFDLTQGRFDERLSMATRMSATVMDQEQYAQTLDLERTVKQQGKQFCFVKTIYAEEGKWFPAPKVSRECYERGRGVDAEETKARMQLLR